MTFILPPFWATPWRVAAAPHAAAVLITPPVLEPLSLTEGKQRAGLDWVAGDPRDALMTGFIQAARSKVERDTGLALLTQTWDVYYDALPAGGQALTLPTRPLQAVTSITAINLAAAAVVLDPASYIVDVASGRIGLALGATWPSDVRPFQPIAIRVVAGWPSVAALTAAHPLLIHAVGLLTAHYATIGRDLTIVGGNITTTPHGYDDALASYLPVSII